MKVLMIDNYDSFTYNIVQYLYELGIDVIVKRNDEIAIEDIKNIDDIQAIVISPGPCTPNEAGISVDIIKEFKGKLPILGVCLGHQSIGSAFGAKITKAKCLMHGKTSMIYHKGKGIFAYIGSSPPSPGWYGNDVQGSSVDPQFFELHNYNTGASGYEGVSERDGTNPRHMDWDLCFHYVDGTSSF